MKLDTRIFLLALATVLAACQSGPESHEPVVGPDIRALEEAGLAHRLLIGTPPGEDVVFPLTGVYERAAEQDPLTAKRRAALGVASMTLDSLVLESNDWGAADAAVTAFLEVPPEGVRLLPAYVLEQVAAHSMYVHRTDEFLRQENREAAGRYVRLLVENRYPNPLPAQAYVDASRDELSSSDIENIVSGTLDATRTYEIAIREAEEEVGCDACLGVSPATATQWANATQALEATRER